MKLLTKEEIVKALYLDLKESYSSITLEWLTEEAEKQLSGAMPTGGPGMFLNMALKQAGLLAES